MHISRTRGRTAALGLALAMLWTLPGIAAAGGAPSAPTPIFGFRIGGDGVVPPDGIGPAFGLRVGIRVHERAAILMDGTVSPLLDDVAHWTLLWGARVNPLLRRSARIDLDLHAGLGRSGGRAMGRFIADGVEQERYPIGRVEFTLLGAVSTRVGLGPRVRYEVQPVFVREVGHLPGGAEEVRDRLRFRGHQALVALAFEADAAQGLGHVSWDIGGGVAIAGDGEEAGAMVRGMFSWTMDARPARAPAVR